MKTFWVLGLLVLLAPLVLLASKETVSLEYSALEYKAIRREMIEADIAVRTLGSLIALGQHKELERQFMLLSHYQTSKHPQLKKPLEAVIQKWRSANLEKHFTLLQKMAAQAQQQVKGKTAANFPWAKVETAYLTILQHCRACHQAVGAGSFEGS